MAHLRSQGGKKPASSEATVADKQMIHLDGRTLEGGGQLVRNAVALSALTGRPITISHIRGNRQGKTGLKGSHAAAIRFISDICQGEIIDGHIGSQNMKFYPRKRGSYHETEKSGVESSTSEVPQKIRYSNLGLPPVKQEYSIQQHTAGSISLVFQALYPYLVYATSQSASKHPIKVHISGGTNVTNSPSIEYLDQVLVPNLLKCGLPRLSINLHKRGWSTGPRDLGAVTFYIHSLEKSLGNPDKRVWFPVLNLSEYRRTTVTKIAITILAPDIDLQHQDAQGNRQARRKAARTKERRDDDDNFGSMKMTVREYLEDKTRKSLRKAMNVLHGNVSAGTRYSAEAPTGDGECEARLPIDLHISEATHHHTHIYILLAAYMSNGLTIGRDALFNGYAKRDSKKNDKSRNGKDGSKGSDGGNNMIDTLDSLVNSCVTGLVEEVKGRDDASDGTGHQPCVDVYMRDQLVIFEALGLLDQPPSSKDHDGERQGRSREDEHYWSLHTQTARWVCEQILGGHVWNTK